MNKNLLILGAKEFGCIAKEIAESMKCFEKIAVLDDESTDDIGKLNEYEALVTEYSYAFVAIDEVDRRLGFIMKLQECGFAIISLISSKAYISPSVQIMQGSLVEPMATICAHSVISTGCRISSGAVVKASSMCCDGVHVDCNATVLGNTLVPAGFKVECGSVYTNEKIEITDLFFDSEAWHKQLGKFNKTQQGPTPIDGREYCFEDGM